jgi:hypothetical protein
VIVPRYAGQAMGGSASALDKTVVIVGGEMMMTMIMIM